MKKEDCRVGTQDLLCKRQVWYHCTTETIVREQILIMKNPKKLTENVKSWKSLSFMRFVPRILMEVHSVLTISDWKELFSSSDRIFVQSTTKKFLTDNICWTIYWKLSILTSVWPVLQNPDSLTSSPVCDIFLRVTSGATPADCMEVSIAAEPFQSTGEDLPGKDLLFSIPRTWA